MTDATLIGKKLVDYDGGVIGTIDDIVVDPHSSTFAWVKVRFGILRDRTLVPIGHITAHPRRPATCDLTKGHVRSAPPVDDRNLDATTRHRLLRYYETANGTQHPAFTRLVRRYATRILELADQLARLRPEAGRRTVA